MLLWALWEEVYGPIVLHQRLDFHFASANWLFANANRNTKKRKRPFNLADFLPKWEKAYKRQPPRFRDVKVNPPDPEKGYLGRGAEVLKKFMDSFK